MNSTPFSQKQFFTLPEGFNYVKTDEHVLGKIQQTRIPHQFGQMPFVDLTGSLKPERPSQRK